MIANLFNSSGTWDYYLLHNVQTGFGAHPVAYAMGAGALPPEVERMMSEADHSLSFRAEIKNAWSYISTALATLWGGV
jgi:hypothetical protein